MITTAPLPTLLQLLLLPYLGRPNGDALARPWLRPGDLGGLWLARSAWSLAVLADAFARARGRRPVVAVPEYICNQSLWPLRQRAELVFYPVRADDLTPDQEGCRDLPAFDLFVLVHYFGWANDGAAARALCDRRGAWLVEDAAHVLRPTNGIGGWGDAVLYSPHKLLAAPDGAVLVVRPGLAAVERHVVDAARALGGAHPPSTAWRLRKLLQRSPLGPLLMRRRPGGQADFTSDPPTLPMKCLPVPSLTGHAMIARADLAAVARSRAANAAALAGVVPGAMAPLFPLGNDVAPYRLVVRLPDKAAAVAAYARLRAAALPVESWPDLPPESPAGSAARRLRDTLLLLPCHQDCRPETLAAAYAAAWEGA